jgi:hypothetical protein
MNDLQVLYHGNCFDGMMSAAIFSRFYLDHVNPRATIAYRGMSHRRGDPFGDDHDATFDARDNAVVDFRYSPSPRLTWWCDHHQTAFMQPEHRAHFETDKSGQKHFDPQAPSCAGLLTRWLARDHGFDTTPFQDHVYWADIIDSANFASPHQAVALAEPALQLMALLEAGPPVELTEQMIRALGRDTIAQVRQLPQVEAAIGPVLQRHEQTVELMRERIEVARGVAFFDLTDTGVEGFNKFVPYHLHADLSYTVGLTLSPTRAKVSVGSNPWRRPEPLTNLADLCGRYGGGGHAVVAAISLPPEALDDARKAAHEITAQLRR